VILALLSSIVLWPLYMAVQVPLWLLGFPVCYFLSRSAAWVYRPSRYFDRFVHAWRPDWAHIWGNEEDGVTGPDWWADKNPNWSIEKRAFVWSAWRNSVNNLRFVSVNPVIAPARVRFVGNSDDPTEIVDGDGAVKRWQWSFTWQLCYAGLALRWQVTKAHHASARIGWKLLPRDRFGVPDWDYRRIRCPFGVQLHLWRKS
jgi:hypothetical protein